MSGSGCTGARNYTLLFFGHDLKVSRSLVLFVKRPDADVESRGNTARCHRRDRERYITGRLRILPHRRVDIAIQNFLSRVGRIAPTDYGYFTGFDADLVEHTLDASGYEVTESDDCLDLATVGSQVIGHTGDNLSLIELGFGNFVGDTERSKHTVNALGLKHSVGRARNF